MQIRLRLVDEELFYNFKRDHVSDTWVTKKEVLTGSMFPLQILMVSYQYGYWMENINKPVILFYWYAGDTFIGWSKIHALPCGLESTNLQFEIEIDIEIDKGYGKVSSDQHSEKLNEG